MAVTTGQQGYKAVLAFGGSDIAKVRDITGPGLSRDDIDISARDNTSQYRTFVPGFTDPGEITFDLVFINENHVALLDAFATTTASSCTLEFYADGGPDVWNFSAYVKAFEPSMPWEGATTASCTLKVSGVIDYNISS